MALRHLGVDGQVSTNTLIHEVLRDMQHDHRPSSSSSVEPLLFPPSLEEAVLGSGEPSFGLPSLIYLLRQGLFGLLGPTILPHTYDRARPIPSGQRRTICEFRTLGRGELEALRRRCKQEGVTVTAALAAAMLLSATDFAHAPHDRSDYVYKFLLSLNMRAFSADSPGQQVRGRQRGGEVVKHVGARRTCARRAAEHTFKLMTGEAGGEGGR